MKALIFNPYLDTLGGGERYTMEVINFLINKKFEVNLAWKDNSIKNKILQRFNIDLERVNIVNNIYALYQKQKNLIEKYKSTKKYDLIFYVSDGSIPLLFGKKNLLLFQSPFKSVGGRSLFNQLKLKTIHKNLCYSSFTKKFIDKEFNINSQVLNPSISSEFESGIKKKIILSVGRFDPTLHPKKQDLMERVFKEIIGSKKLEGWKLILAGGVLHGRDFVKKLKTSARGYPITIKTNISFKELKKLYAQAKIYWHAAGFGENLIQHPQRAEHFGISVVESMASGCLPIAFNGGGLPEIITDGKNGFLFDSLDGLKKLTIKIASDENTRKELVLKAQKRAKDFSKEIFFEKLNELIK